MRLGIVTFDAVRIHVACSTCRIGTLRIMAGGTAFHIPTRKAGVLSSAASNTDDDKTRFRVRYRLKLDLIDIAAGGMAGSTECLLVMARLAIRCFACGRNAMRKAEIKVVHLGQFLTLTAAVGS